jgi:hypothetical protein
MRIETKHENDEIGWGEAVQLSFTRWPNMDGIEMGLWRLFVISRFRKFFPNYFSLISIEN